MVRFSEYEMEITLRFALEDSEGIIHSRGFTERSFPGEEILPNHYRLDWDEIPPDAESIGEIVIQSFHTWKDQICM